MANRNESVATARSGNRQQNIAIDRNIFSNSAGSLSTRDHVQTVLKPKSQIDPTPSRDLQNNRKLVSAPVTAIDPKAFTAVLYSSANPALELGNKGPAVVELKKLLNGTRGFLQKKLDVTSDIFDAQTAAAVAKFQSQNSLTRDFKVISKPGLGCDGVAGKWTITALLIKNGFGVPAERAQNLRTRLDQCPGERWAEVAVKRSAVSSKSTQQVALYQGTSAFGKENFPYQRHSYDCGPTACGTALGIITGRDKEALAAHFRSQQGQTGMSWENPKKFARQVGASCLQLNTSDPERIAHYLRNGCTAVVSIKKTSPLTENGHILALHKVKGEGSKLQFENLDPNANNLPQYNVLSASQISTDVRQVWVFGSKDLLAKLSQKPQYLASR